MPLHETILSFIPKIGGFSPMPLGIMAPFMAYQSATMAYAFGLNYEFGKRKIKSMSNEEFNSLSPEKLENIQAQHHAVPVQTFITAVPLTDDIQREVLTKMVELEKQKIQMLPELIAQTLPAILAGIANLTPKQEQTEETQKIIEDFQQDLDVNAPAPISSPTPELTPETITPVISDAQKQARINIDSLSRDSQAKAKELQDLKLCRNQRNINSSYICPIWPGGPYTTTQYATKISALENLVKLLVAQLYNLRVQYKNQYGTWY